MVDDTLFDALFATPPADFVAARDALAKKALEGGDTQLASQIHALRKPMIVVWLINQLARRHRDEVAALTEAGKQLREAQLTGLGSTFLREANEAWRVAITAALRRIREIAGRSIDEPRIVSTLMGAVADRAHADLLARGRLTEELEPPGVEGVLSELAKAPPPPRRKEAREQQAAKTTPSREELRAEHERQREAAKELRSREREAEKATKEAEGAERAAAQLEGRAKAAADRAATARQAAEEAARRAKMLAEEVQRLRRQAVAEYRRAVAQRPLKRFGNRRRNAVASQWPRQLLKTLSNSSRKSRARRSRTAPRTIEL
jgi:hypothetical protein